MTMTTFRRGSLSCPSLDVASGSLLVPPPNPSQSPPQFTSKVKTMIMTIVILFNRKENPLNMVITNIVAKDSICNV